MIVEAEWVQAIAFVVYDTLLVAALLYAAKQVAEIRSGRQAQAYLEVVSRLQRESLRRDRRTVFKADPNWEHWTDKEKEAGERVAHNFDLLARVTRYRLFPEEWLLGSYQNSLSMSWQKLRGMVKQYQEQRGREFWSHFEMVAEAAGRLDAAVDWAKLTAEIERDIEKRRSRIEESRRAENPGGAHENARR